MERLALIEILEHDGRSLQAVDVLHWPVTVGRDLACDIVLNDPHVAPHHASFDRADGAAGGVQLRVGDSRNGVRLTGPRLHRQLPAGASAALPAGALCHVGRHALRVRLAGEVLAPEVPLGLSGGRAVLLLTALGTVLVLAWMMFNQWLINEPGTGWDKYVPALLGPVIGIAAWSSLWGLGSKIFQRHFRILPHLQVLLGFLLGNMALDGLLQLAAYSLSLPWLSHVRGWVEMAVFAALVATHVTVLLPERARRVRWTFAALSLAAIGVSGALDWRHHQRLFDELFTSALPPPASRLAGTHPVQVLVDDMKPVQAVLQKRAHDDDEEDRPSADD